MRTFSALFGAMAIAFLMVGQVHAQPSRPKSFIWKQCNEDVLVLDVDPRPLQTYVDSAFSIALDDGRARVLIVAQNCPTYWFDGVEIGPTQEVHMWVTVEAPADIRPVIGAESTLPTMTWFNVFTGSSNAQARNAWTASGTPTLMIESLALDPKGPRRGGQVSVDGDLRYSWQVESEPPFARLIGVNHDVYGKASSGNIVYNRIQCLTNVFAWNSPGTLEVTGGTDPTKLIAPGKYEVAVHTFLPLWCRASLADTPPR